MNTSEVLEGIEWLGHASFKISKDKVIYIDPWKVKAGQVADIILITHEHYDHCSSADVEKLKGAHTVIVTTPDCAEKLSGDVRAIKPGQAIEVEGLRIEAVPAYNVGKPFHPKASGWVGYIVTTGGLRIYHAGDTDVIPEMDRVKADVALLPVGGTYTMGPEEAAQAANTIGPRVAVPMHYGSIVGSARDVRRFKEACQVPVEVLG